jgi:hypothetical protein
MKKASTKAQSCNATEPVAVAESKAQAQEYAPLASLILAPALPIAALRIVKKAKAPSRGLSEVTSSASSTSEVAPSKSSPSSSTASRVPSPADAPSLLRLQAVPVSQGQKGSSMSRPSLAEPSARPSKASIVQYGPVRAALATSKRSAVDRPSSIAVTRPPLTAATIPAVGLKRGSTVGAASSARLPAIPKASGIRPPSRFGTASVTPVSTTTSRFGNPVISKTAVPSGRASQPARDVARILRGPERPKTAIKRV